MPILTEVKTAVTGVATEAAAEVGGLAIELEVAAAKAEKKAVEVGKNIASAIVDEAMKLRKAMSSSRGQ